jgi:aspartate kinase
MQVLKFGGTSVGNPDRMRQVMDIIDDGRGKIIVLSAVSGTTNQLVELSAAIKQGQHEVASRTLAQLEQEYAIFIEQLLKGNEAREAAANIVQRSWALIAKAFDAPFFESDEKNILAQGEIISTQLFQLLLKEHGISAVLLPALDFMRIDENEEPELGFIRENLTPLLNDYPENSYFITQGYICRNAYGAVDNLKRGGSDYTATLIGAAVQAGEIQIWTDIDGLHNNDPRVVHQTFPIRKVSYREAAELAYFGAKILHPTCVIPAEQENTPIRLKNTFEPAAPGTLISSECSGRKITAIAAKGGITAIRIRSGRMLNAYGFLRKVFEIFETFKTPIDMITTSEVSVSLTIDDDRELENILTELRHFGEVSIDRGQTIICIVGDGLNRQSGHTKTIFAALEHIPLRMVSYGGSLNNISILLDEKDKDEALQALHQFLFNGVETMIL